MIHIVEVPTPVGTRSKAWVYGRSLAVFVGPNPTAYVCICMYVCIMYVVSVVCCQVELSASG